MTRIAIVEDEAAVREQLAGYVQRYTRQYGTPFEVTEFADGMEIQMCIRDRSSGGVQRLARPGRKPGERVQTQKPA